MAHCEVGLGQAFDLGMEVEPLEDVARCKGEALEVGHAVDPQTILGASNVGLPCVSPTYGCPTYACYEFDQRVAW